MPEGEGEKLDASVVAFRLEVLATVLGVGDPVERIDAYRPFFERSGLSLTTASHMRQLIPVLARRQQEQDSSLVKGKAVAVIFDGTSHFGELLLVLVRYFDGRDFHQRLIRLRHSDAPLDQNTLSFILDRALHRAGINSSDVVAFLKDTASVNFAAVNMLKSLNYSRALNMPCFSHTFNRVGKKLKLDIARAFIATWSSFFSKSMKVPTPLLINCSYVSLFILGQS